MRVWLLITITNYDPGINIESHSEWLTARAKIKKVHTFSLASEDIQAFAKMLRQLLSIVLFELRNKSTRMMRPPCLVKFLQRDGSFMSWERQVTMMPLWLFTRICSFSCWTSNNSDIVVSFLVNDVACITAHTRRFQIILIENWNYSRRNMRR